jgi:hypothetical protein
MIDSERDEAGYLYLVMIILIPHTVLISSSDSRQVPLQANKLAKVGSIMWEYWRKASL